MEKRQKLCKESGRRRKRQKYSNASTRFDGKLKLQHFPSKIEVYNVACESAEIEKICSVEAYKTYLELEKLKDFNNYILHACKDVDFVRKIENGFFPHLQMDLKRRLIFEEVLEYFKVMKIAAA
ncbi:hypothetical protein NPIL_66941 [Nephila pilipes]|uniref:Uncharacterized protein n=1 Tax=Nephila pilipes TaxID=299642 RepID=A0A8X6NT03_NEPPI|nr:hypothetical protein NPIL_66941 [Nephila pilipes]